MSLYESVTGEGYPKKRYEAYILHNPGTEGQWPGPWWGQVHDTWGFGIDGFLTARDAWDFLQREFPEKTGAVQEIIWVAEPTKWTEATKPGSRGWHPIGGLQ